MAGTMNMALNTLVFSRFPQLGLALLVLVVMGIGLSACASNRERVVAIYVERPIGQIYADAWAQIQRGNWLIAGVQFDEVERQHPYSIWARRAMLMSAYSYYQANQYDEAIRATNAFIQLHPGNRKTLVWPIEFGRKWRLCRFHYFWTLAGFSVSERYLALFPSRLTLPLDVLTSQFGATI